MLRNYLIMMSCIYIPFVFSEECPNQISPLNTSTQALLFEVKEVTCRTTDHGKDFNDLKKAICMCYEQNPLDVCKKSFKECEKKYGVSACIEQEKIIKACMESYPKDSNRLNCKIGHKANFDGTYQYPHDFEKLKSFMMQSENLSKILGTSVTGEFPTYKSSKKIMFNSIKNDMDILIDELERKITIYSRNYNNAFVYSEVTIALEDGNINVSGNTYLKNYTYHNTPGINYLISKGMSDTEARIQKIINPE